MHLYRFHFLDAAGTVTRCHSAQLPSEKAAVNLASRMLAERGRDDAVEIWHLNHLVHCEKAPRAVASR